MAPAVPRVDFTRSIGTRVGEGLQQSGRLDGDGDAAGPLDAGAARTFARYAALLAHLLHCDQCGSARGQPRGVRERVRALVGTPLRVLDGDEEADASLSRRVDVLDPHRAAARVGVIDTGGGSTEYASATARIRSERFRARSAPCV